MDAAIHRRRDRVLSDVVGLGVAATIVLSITRFGVFDAVTGALLVGALCLGAVAGVKVARTIGPMMGAELGLALFPWVLLALFLVVAGAIYESQVFCSAVRGGGIGLSSLIAFIPLVAVVIFLSLSARPFGKVSEAPNHPVKILFPALFTYLVCEISVWQIASPWWFSKIFGFMALLLISMCLIGPAYFMMLNKKQNGW